MRGPAEHPCAGPRGLHPQESSQPHFTFCFATPSSSFSPGTAGGGSLPCLLSSDGSLAPNKSNR